MPKMFIDPVRHVLNGPTMGTGWSATLFAEPAFPIIALQHALQKAVDGVDQAMSSWRPDSDLMRLNAAPVGAHVVVPAPLMTVLRAALEVGRASHGAFEIAMGDAVAAWGFGPAKADTDAIRAARQRPRKPSYDTLDLDTANLTVRKREAVTLDLSGIAKGYGVDRLAETLAGFGLKNGLVAIDGELRALGIKPDGSPWKVAVDRPDRSQRSPHSVVVLEEAAIATSGDYRHWVQVGNRSLSHTMDPRTGAPLPDGPASVTVVAQTCMMADALATALMVMGIRQGQAFAENQGIDALFLMRDEARVTATTAGRLFGDTDAAALTWINQNI